MGLLLVIFPALLLTGFCSGGPATLTPGTCWSMGSLHSTFDNQYYTFMGNCTYTMAKSCNSATVPAFEVDADYMNSGKGGVPSVGAVAVNVHGFHIEIVRSMFGIVRVNYQDWALPINLNNGLVTLYQRGLFVVVETDFGLTVKYDWNQFLAIMVPGSFSGSVCGLCGNFNNKAADDLTGSVEALGASWRVPSAADDAFCRDGCGGQCADCPLSEVQQLEYLILCKTIPQDIPQYAGCQPGGINATLIQNNCMLDLCSGENENTYLCNTLQGYAELCQMSGSKGSNWRTATQCSVPVCPTNSHYEFCGTSCPATCSNPSPPAECSSPCVEACVCNDGFVLSGTECVPQAQCGCTYEGHYVKVGASFWGDDACTTRYTCSAGGLLSLSRTSCPAGQECQVAGGLRGCYPVDHATCMVSGDPHVVTFDGERYDFQGTCSYELAGVAANAKGLETFSVVLQNSGRDKKIGSSLSLVEVQVNGYTVVISRVYPGTAVVNGELSNLPLTLDSSLHLYTSGWFAVLETASGVQVYYDWGSVAFVTVPSAYMGTMQGLCGNYNLNPKDDMQMRNGTQAATPKALGQSWTVGTVPGCVDGCSGPCPGCNSTQKAQYSTNSACGLIADPAGPFRDCHAKLDPTGFLEDCLYDVCLYEGKGNMQCKTLTAYTAACQLKGISVYPWRSAQFCDAACPSNSHYELCTSSCVGSCATDCGAQCMEGCACNEGYLMSGDECVPANQCGCMYEGRYYQQGEVFYPDALCQKECTCNSTQVQCVQSSCGPNEKCDTKDYVRSCQPSGIGVCFISGDPHYHTFDNSTYDFQGTCTYTAAESCHLTDARLPGFSVAVENEKWYRMSDNPQVSVAKLVAVEVYGNILILRRNEVNLVWVNGILQHLPLTLLNGAVKVYQEGTNDVIMTDFGLRVTYDLVYHVTVTVPGSYRGRTCGLCGNFNGDAADEFQLPDGSVTKELQAFGAAWKVPVPGVVCEDGCSGDTCPTCDDSTKAAIEGKCAIITNPEGPFSACHGVIEPASYYRDCVYDVCLAKDEQRVLCQSVSAYMLDCQNFGAVIQNWRTPSFCPLKCGANSHYEVCARPCSASCPGLLEVMTCPTACVEGCVCDSSYSYNGTGCVPTDQCSCYYKGQTLEVGQSVITDDCRSVHTCQASGVVLSKNMSCDPNERCQVKNGKLGCFLQQCTVGQNATVTAFNGETGAVKKAGTYEIVQNCDQSATTDWFRVVVKFDTCTPGVNSFMAMYVFFTDVMIIVNNKHDVWINGKAMTQSTFSLNDVKVLRSNNTVTISNPSSLQLTFTPSDQLVISVSDKAADMVCGACGKLQPVDSTLRALRQSLLKSLQAPSTVFASLNIEQWTAPDFPQCGS
ncbi:IgGFc-binding protein-like [Betta splendens]|uniref:IgGFc-binding protein-like n=1 Tax=Betta splendens TaxID=158456 RepID=A0A6P7NV82_BETSP|nr:IgGFc-binding protein-like [Betta splendens]